MRKLLLSSALPLLILAASASSQTGAVSCLDAASSVELASAGRDEYGFTSTGHAVDASDVVWSGLFDHVLELVGSQSACFAGGKVAGPYGDAAVYECKKKHCPRKKCQKPCLAYHLSAALAPAVSAPLTVIDDFEASGYGDGISLEEDSGDLLIRRAYLHDLHDDAVESDWGNHSVSIHDALFDRVNMGLATRQRKRVSRDSTDETWELRRSLVRLHAFPNTYRMRPGHAGFFKVDEDDYAQVRYRITSNVFFAGPVAVSGAVLFPIVTQTDECAGNQLFWSGSQEAWEEVLDDGEGYPDDMTNRERLAALSSCYTVTVKPALVSEAAFVAQHWTPRAAAWRASHAADAP